MVLLSQRNNQQSHSNIIVFTFSHIVEIASGEVLYKKNESKDTGIFI